MKPHPALSTSLYETCMKKAFTQVPVSARSAVVSELIQPTENVLLRERTCTWANQPSLGGTARKSIQLRSKNPTEPLQQLESPPFLKNVKRCETRFCKLAKYQ